MWYDSKKLANAIKHVKKVYNITYEKIAEEVGVSKSHMSKVLKGERNLSPEAVRCFCEKFNVDRESLMPDEESNPTAYKIGAAIRKRIKERNIVMLDLSHKTDISVFDLHDIITDTKEPTEDEVMRIASALNVDPKVFLIPDYVSGFFELSCVLAERFNLDEQTISTVCAFVESKI